MNALTNPFPPTSTAPTYARIASESTQSCSETRDVHPRRAAIESRRPPTAPTTSATRIARPMSTIASRIHEPPSTPSSLKRAARNTVTNGVAMPSFSPLSMFSARRMRTGTARSVTTAMPSAASVGARTEAMSAAPAQPSSGARTSPRIVPGDDREQKSDTEEPTGNAGITFDGAQRHRARIGEQQRSERDLREGEDHFAVERELEQSGTVGAERHPGGHEDHRCADAAAGRVVAPATHRPPRSPAGSRCRSRNPRCFARRVPPVQSRRKGSSAHHPTSMKPSETFAHIG